MFFSARAQQRANVDDLKAIIKGQTLWISWKYNNAPESNYWELQGSADGISFQAIGLVLGAKPGKESEYIFKCNNSKMKKGLKIFRVLQIQNDQTAVVYNAVLIK